MQTAQVAARWFVLRLDDAPTTREDRVRWRVGWVVAYVVSLGFWDLGVKQRALIEVLRRDDDTVVATFPETGERLISERLLELRTALLGLDAATFCQRYAIPASAVVGPGEDVVEDELVR
ncbi:hypothetical protein [Pimelobacter sp. 30-1]|uniref:hypothetical protein n=1 Tax=Pimelobacter sp. 30-1 TaxID=2004991 RepID=UPI001C0433FF|nr:hypothetical protein [Pimelobacter sp. 30-1]MBU2693775.1 hypothetical protein [Pimelobacter sp. 30-1]